ncbi:hypothetical protein H8356DRAFT_1361697 [Neocallimastix lanati (nom. inval.)]|nr:hypothetical protein H8356DRAFT_1361697 [Neocallimastix sp. JGI-2020a]
MVYNQVKFITINLNIFIQLHSLIRLRSLSGDLEPLRSFTSLRARSLTPLLSLDISTACCYVYMNYMVLSLILAIYAYVYQLTT